MKCKIPEISWHNRDPVLSVDLQPKTEKSDLYRLASGGTDAHVLIWSLCLTEAGEVNMDVAADLTRHQRAVNVVKWSPNGELLASGDDESVVFIWKQKEDSELINILDKDSTNEHDKEIWITLKVLRGHMEDIYDLSWSPNSQFLVSCSVDNTAIVWDVHKGKSISILNDHKGFVQGVAWDPKNQYIASLSTDRFLRIFDIQTKKVVYRVSKAPLPVSQENELYGKKIRLYHDDTLQTFFRRLCFSPDGKLLFTPAGVVDYDGVTHLVHTTYIFSRYSLKQPSVVLPSPDQYTVAVKCCPILFQLRRKTDASSTAILLPYRIIFAIATKSSVYLYDTQQKVPFGLISNIHYTRLTDITWSNDGRILIVSSTDGFCSLITFEKGELGEEYTDVSSCPPIDMTNEKKSLKNKHKQINLDINQKLYTGNSIKNNKNKDTCLIEMLSTDIILDKDIISSDEKFESPEKKSRSPTPIVVRRHPRTQKNTAKPSSNIIKVDLVSEKNITMSSNKRNVSSSYTKECAKRATPIAIRRQPRLLIPTAVEKTAIVEEALDAWPLKPDAAEDHIKSAISFQDNCKLNIPVSTAEISSGCTEDIRLVYEETVEAPKDCASHNPVTKELDKLEKIINVQVTAEQKPPRRVQLKTISTPKSKKQLLE